MGIPRLTSHLQAYSSQLILGCDKAECQKHHIPSHLQSSVIIDGPGLAYFIYYRLLAHKSSSLNALDGAPSYAELGRATLQFLDKLQSCRLVIDKIYFDGFLPPQKRATRLERLEANLKQLVAFHASHPNGLNIAKANAKSTLNITTSQLFDSSCLTPTTLRGLPAAAFLVPAVLEAICESQYAAITQVVPGEADLYCAEAARKGNIIIMTSDSDMLVYDLGPLGAVAFFNQIELRKQECRDGGLDPCEVLQAHVSKTSNIAQRLQLENLHRLSFEIKEDPTATFDEVVRRAKQPSTKEVLLGEFIKEYTAKTSPWVPNAAAPGKCLDPRVSELVLQVSSASEDSLSMYLPFLLDDVSKMSTWATSSGLRCFVYSLFIHTKRDGNHPKIIMEYSRKGFRIAPEKTSLLAKQECTEYAVNLNARLNQAKEISVNSPKFVWTIFGVYEVYRWYLDGGRNPPSKKIMSRVTTGRASGMWTWDDVQVSAQLQAVLYALRVTKQVLDQLRSMTSTALPTAVLDLGAELANLPALSELLPSRHERIENSPLGVTVGDMLDNLIRILRDGNGRFVCAEFLASKDKAALGSPPSCVAEVSKSPKARRKRPEKHAAEDKTFAKSSPQQTNNMYSALPQIGI